MLIGGISPYSKVVTLTSDGCKFLRKFMTFKVEIFFNFFVTYFAVKVSINWWNFFYNAKGGKYHSPEKHLFSSELSHYNLWGCFLPPFRSHSAVYSTYDGAPIQTKDHYVPDPNYQELILCPI